MGYEPARCPDGPLVVTKQRTGSRLAVTLSGRLDLDGVEDLAACADQICRSAVRTVVFTVAALTAVDEAGARTLGVACRCLCAHGLAVYVRGVGPELHAMLDRLAIALPAPPVRARRSADLIRGGVAVQQAAIGLGLGGPGPSDGRHDGVQLAGLFRGDPVEQRPPDLLDV
jgi:anti-anti-sigma regulatory factor